MKIFIEAKNRKELRKKINESDYSIIKKTCEGYSCFETESDYYIYSQQK